MPADAFDYVVVGAGLAGAATAWQLATRGHQVAVVERSVPANDAGSSHGSARIFRYAYAEAGYSALVKESLAGWEELARLAGQPLITPTGCVDYGQDRRPRELAGGLERLGIGHQLLSAEEARGRWPQFAFDTEVLWHQGAGVLDARETVHTMLRAAAGHGARLYEDWELAGARRTGTGYLLTNRRGEQLEAGRLVVAAGGWLPRLLGGLDLPPAFLAALPAFTVMQETAFHFPYREQPGPGKFWPTFIHKRPGIQTYGLPGGRDADFRGQKLAEFNGGKAIPDASAQDGLIDPAHRARIVEYVKRYIPGLVPEPYAETTCLFTNTPNEDFVIDTADGVTVLSPCSGHGAKFAPLLGSLAADLATGSAGVPDRFRPSLVAAGGKPA
ncbi:FAD-dependent oxidoreductase [Arthrobacter mobilis]|uniref:FAD-dependent oxidoreductase n=1 Tax=Arthrobacter mobilis TaxID=2724944 RepID=A0A7X6K5Y4_9MICC|nr:FAD-dependent oxidoreductase [Arthrobacter mobilis]NKX54455.1 FAD-dependent oxidoreductase [Arthrobacter mobilis]